MREHPASLYPVWSGLFVLTVFLVLPAALAVDPLPPAQPGTEIGGILAAGYEPSGAAWHPRYQQLCLVSDNGYVSMMDQDGLSIIDWRVPGDLEGVCLADPESDIIYLGVEHPDSIAEFNLASGQVMRTFRLDGWMQGPTNEGLEALTFVPDSNSTEGGYFYAGLQCTGEVFIFELPIRSSATSTEAHYLGRLTLAPGRGDISGLDYDVESGILYSIWDSANRLRATSVSGEFIDEWLLPGNDQEGIAVYGCGVFIAEDVGKEVWRYAFYGCQGDQDGDGVGDCVDLCPDTPAGCPVTSSGCMILEDVGADRVTGTGLGKSVPASTP